jgi:phosphohistidine phosphatase
MKQLLLIRHAKASHESGYTDFERPLTEKGVKNAHEIAQNLQKNGIKPQLLVTSPALRTHTTANIFTETLGLAEPMINKVIYDASEDTLLRVINELPDEQDFIALVGHNPGINQILYTLTGEHKEVHPGTAALIEFEADSWQEVSADTGKLTYYDDPKED